MADLTIRRLPDELHAWLKQQAEAHHRSVNKETIAVLEAASAQGERPRLSAGEILTVAKRFAALTVLESRSADEILGYDNNGLPG